MPGVVSALAASGIPTTALEAYVRAAAGSPASCQIAWTLIAGIGRVESDHGRFAGAQLLTDGRSAPPIIGIALDGTRSALIRDTDGGRLDGDQVYDRAVGPTQFIPSTWATYASDGDGNGTSDPFDIDDAAAATAKYLCAAGGDLSSVAGQRQAVLTYNHSDEYVATVLGIAASYAGTPPPVLPTEPAKPPTLPPANPAPPPAVAALPPATAPAAGARTPAATPSPATASATAGPSATPAPSRAPAAVTPTPTPTPDAADLHAHADPDAHSYAGPDAVPDAHADPDAHSYAGPGAGTGPAEATPTPTCADGSTPTGDVAAETGDPAAATEPAVC